MLARRGGAQVEILNPKGARVMQVTGPNRSVNSKPVVQNDSLQTWKEIAAYLRRGVRSVQRWEANAGLPVRRVSAGERSPVIALRSEIDEWLSSRPTRSRRSREPNSGCRHCGYLTK
jgi:hypothetical protein